MRRRRILPRYQAPQIRARTFGDRHLSTREDVDARIDDNRNDGDFAYDGRVKPKAAEQV